MKLYGACIQTHRITTLVDFYKTIFGYSPEVNGGVDYRFYDAQLILYRLEDAQAPATRNAALIYAVDDVDTEYQRLLDLGITVNAPPTDKPWGVRSFIINDPDGNTVSFFTRINC
jgi:predicted enzyme related to lactoylglutathione lyase